MIFAVSAVLWWLVLQAEQTVPVPDTTTLIIGGVILLAAFLGGELFPLQIEVRRETLLVSGSELPMVLGLLLLPAWVGRADARRSPAPWSSSIRRDSWRNIAVNLSFIAVETGTAALVMLLIVGRRTARDRAAVPRRSRSACSPAR